MLKLHFQRPCGEFHLFLTFVRYLGRSKTRGRRRVRVWERSPSKTPVVSRLIEWAGEIRPEIELYNASDKFHKICSMENSVQS